MPPASSGCSTTSLLPGYARWRSAAIDSGWGVAVGKGVAGGVAVCVAVCVAVAVLDGNAVGMLRATITGCAAAPHAASSAASVAIMQARRIRIAAIILRARPSAPKRGQRRMQWLLNRKLPVARPTCPSDADAYPQLDELQSTNPLRCSRHNCCARQRGCGW